MKTPTETRAANNAEKPEGWDIEFRDEYNPLCDPPIVDWSGVPPKETDNGKETESRVQQERVKTD